MAVVLFSALLHASWNALVRSAADKFDNTVLIVVSAGALAACALPWLAFPAAASWPFLVASVLIHTAYFWLVAFAYRGAGLSFVYPIMRGTAPVFSALVVFALLSESPSFGGWIGLLMICSGVTMLAGDAWRVGNLNTGALWSALLNAAVIVLYTVVDGQGVRLARGAFAYTGWMFALTGVLLLAGSMSIRNRGGTAGIVQRMRRHWKSMLLGGACTLGSYTLALWAMTRAPIATVAALRETSVVFAAIIAASLLHEPVSRLRYLSITTVSLGAIAIKLF